MNEDRKDAIRKRFHLLNGMFFGDYKFKNLWWHLNGEQFGFGDLREHDIEIIASALEAGEVFEGFNEHHNGRWMQRESPMVRITVNGVEYPERVPLTDETRKRLREEFGR